MTPEESAQITRSETIEGLFLAGYFSLIAFVVFAAIVLVPALLMVLGTKRHEREAPSGLRSLHLSLLGCLMYLPFGVGAFGFGVSFATRTLSNGIHSELAVVRNVAVVVAVPIAVLCVLLPKHRLVVWFVGLMICLVACGAVGAWGPP